MSVPGTPDSQDKSTRDMAEPKTPTKQVRPEQWSSARKPSQKDLRTPRVEKALAPEEVSDLAPALTVTSRPSWIWLVLPLVVAYGHVLLAPYTKVEETPALHAVYDHLTHGLMPEARAKYEHVVYPGAVPRSMIPSLHLAMLVKPVTEAARLAGCHLTGLQVQIIVRLALATTFALSLGHMTITLHRISSSTTARAFVLLTVTQFHIMYYAGRTLPNFLALPFFLYGYSSLLRWSSIQPTYTGSQPPTWRKANRDGMYEALAHLTLIATVIRLEIAPMPVAIALVLVKYRYLSFLRTLVAGSKGGFQGLALTAMVDSYFYQGTSHQLKFWPELSAFMFNVPQGRSAEWGTSPPWAYLATLPKLLLFSLPLAAIEVPRVMLSGNVEERQRSVMIVVPCLSLIFALSTIGHKEWRFIIYVVPLINVLAASCVSWLLRSIQAPPYRRLAVLLLLGGLVANAVVTTAFTLISRDNYPGGKVGVLLERIAANTRGEENVWLPAAALHSGTTLFTMPPDSASWEGRYDSLGNLTIVRPESSYEASARPSGNSPAELYDAGFDWVVTDDWAAFLPGDDQVEAALGKWTVVDEIQGFTGVNRLKTWPFVRINRERRLALMSRVDR